MTSDVPGPQQQDGGAVKALDDPLIGPAAGGLVVPVGGQALHEGEGDGKHMLGDGGAVTADGGGQSAALGQDPGGQIGGHPGGPSLEPLQMRALGRFRHRGTADNDGGPPQLLLRGGPCVLGLVGYGAKQVLRFRRGGLEGFPLGLGQAKKIEDGFHSKGLL